MESNEQHDQVTAAINNYITEASDLHPLDETEYRTITITQPFQSHFTHLLEHIKNYQATYPSCRIAILFAAKPNSGILDNNLNDASYQFCEYAESQGEHPKLILDSYSYGEIVQLICAQPKTLIGEKANLYDPEHQALPVLTKLTFHTIFQIICTSQEKHSQLQEQHE